MSEDLKAELERLRAEDEALKQGRRGVSLKVSEKGGVSVYLYKEQWEKLLAMADEIKKFIADNKDRLKVKE